MTNFFGKILNCIKFKIEDGFFIKLAFSLRLSLSLFLLKNDGYRTWIDVDHMGGSTLEAMAAAVENAAVVLVCACEKYKLSPNCRTGK